MSKNIRKMITYIKKWRKIPNVPILRVSSPVELFVRIIVFICICKESFAFMQNKDVSIIHVAYMHTKKNRNKHSQNCLKNPYVTTYVTLSCIL